MLLKIELDTKSINKFQSNPTALFQQTVQGCVGGFIPFLSVMMMTDVNLMVQLPESNPGQMIRKHVLDSIQRNNKRVRNAGQERKCNL